MLTIELLFVTTVRLLIQIVNGRTANTMVLVSVAGQMDVATVENGKTAGQMDMEWKRGQMGQSVTTVNGKMIVQFANRRRPLQERIVPRTKVLCRRGKAWLILGGNDSVRGK